MLFLLVSMAGGVFGQSLSTPQDWLSYFKKTDKDKDLFLDFFDSLRIKEEHDRDEIIQHIQSRYGEDSRTKLMHAMSAYLHNKLVHGKSWRTLWWEAEKLASDAGEGPVLYKGYYYFGDVYNELNILDTSAFYLVKSVELAKSLEFADKNLYAPLILASHALIKTHNYKECIEYCKEALQFINIMKPLSGISALNNLGLSYLKTGQLVNSRIYFQKAANHALEKGYMAWWAISMGNIGDVLYLEGKEKDAYNYWQIDVDTCRKYGETYNALLSDAYISRYQFRQDGHPRHISNIRNSYEKLKGLSLETDVILSKTLRDFYSKVNRKDSSIHFHDIYTLFNDSLNSIVSRNNYNYLLLKYEYENKEKENSLLKQRREAEVQRRNFLLLLLIAILIISGLLYNRQRLKLKFEKHQKSLAEEEAIATKDELRRFTNVLLEKNKQIESLNQAIIEQQESTQDELVHQTLLTDDEWYRFKDLFEKSYPGFLVILKNEAQDITAAEIRLAALMRLGLDNKQMASMQGVSVGAIRTTKTRLRNKLNLPSTEDLAAYIMNLD